MVDFSNIKFDKSWMFDFQKLNPQEIFEKLGMSNEDTEKIMKGDFEPAAREPPFIVDYNVFLSNYGEYFNSNLIKYLFKLSRENKELTIEEQDAYNEGIINFFEIVFRAGSDGIFLIDLTGETNEQCLLIRFEGLYYTLVRTPDTNKIFFLRKTSI
jgi:hypothetical protein